MTLEQLRIFVAVAEREHVTQAAQALNLTQSAVSAAIGALESRHDVILFNRIGRRVALTEAGRLFLGEARRLLRASLRTERVLADLGAMRVGGVSVAASQTIGNYWLPERLARFKIANPGICVRLSIGNTEEVAALAAAGDVDFGLVEGEARHELIESEIIDADDLAAVTSPDMAERIRSGALALAEAPWVAREKGSGTRAAFELALRQLAPELAGAAPALELPSNEAVLTAVAAGAGVTVASRLVAAPYLRSGALRQLPEALPRRTFYLLRHKQIYLSRAARALLDACRPAKPPHTHLDQSLLDQSLLDRDHLDHTHLDQTLLDQSLLETPPR
jgi:DNA-binding transcriptional LysR family regulator